MVCEHVAKWTVEFPWIPGEDGQFEIRPIQMSFSINRTGYDYCRAKFPYEVGNMMSDQVSNPDHPLRYPTVVNIKYDGTTVRKLLWKPQYIKYGRKFTHIQFQDLQRTLADGSLDMKRSAINIFEAYERIIEGAENPIIQDVEYNLPEGAAVIAEPQKVNLLGDPADGEFTVDEDNPNNFQEIEFDGFDHEDITPEKAIQELNSLFSVQSWVRDDRTLMVGIPEGREQNHFAAPNDDRVWRYKDPQTKEGREPVKTVFVKGKYTDLPGHDMADSLDVMSDKGLKDVQLFGIASRTDIDRGKSVAISDQKVGQDAIEYRAENALMEEVKTADRGTVELDTNNSGHQVSHPIEAKPGDSITLVPHDKHFDNPSADSGVIGDRPPRDELCAGFVHNRTYFITEVEHNLTEGGHYGVFIDLGIYPSMEIETAVAYWKPDSEQWISRASFNDLTTDNFGSWMRSEGHLISSENGEGISDDVDEVAGFET